MSKQTYLHVRVVEGRKIPSLDFAGKSDPYCLLQLSSGQQVYRTKVVDNSATPVWNEDFQFPVRDASKDILHILLKDSDLGALSADDQISRGKIALSGLKVGVKSDQWLTLEAVEGASHEGGEVHVWVRLTEGPPAGW
jgi:Ca2+-dependent lipid-binding protein